MLVLLSITGCATGDQISPENTAHRGLAVQNIIEAPPVPSAAIEASLIEVIDGDTFAVSIDGTDEIVRLLGIDTPEKAGGPRPAECYGEQATLFARQLVPKGSKLWLSGDVETRDQYGRLLAFVHRPDGLLVNLAMVENGYASPLFFAPNLAMVETFTQAGDSARRQWLGFWPACGSDDVVLSQPRPTSAPTAN